MQTPRSKLTGLSDEVIQSLLAACWVLFLLVVGVWWLYRLRLGVDVSDEAWYVATTYRLILGDRPYIDEIFLMQGFSLLLFPVFKLLGIGSTTEGIVLSSRYLYAAFNASVGICVAYSLRKWLSRRAQITLIFAWICFLPYGIPNLSYNTLGLGFIALGFCVLLERLIYRRYIAAWYLFGLCMGAALLAHPSMLTVCAVAAFSAAYLEKDSKALAVALYFLGGLTIGILAVTLYSIPLVQLKENYDLTLAMNTAFKNRPDMTKVFKVITAALQHGPVGLSLLLISLRAKVARKYVPIACLSLFVFLVPLTALLTRSRWGGMGAHGATIYIGLLAPAIFALIHDRKTALIVLIGGWLPAAVGALATSTTSYSGLYSAGAPMELCSICTFALMMMWFDENRSGIQALLQPRFAKLPMTALRVLPLLLWIALFSYLTSREIYFEDPIRQLTQRVRSGPFRGLHTTPTKANYVHTVEDLVKPYQQPPGRILFYPTFPAGYLMTRRAPAINTTWGCMGLENSVCENYVTSKHSADDVWVRVSDLFLNTHTHRPHRADHFLDRYLSKERQSTAEFEVFKQGDWKEPQ
jgi:hypothetical protein